MALVAEKFDKNHPLLVRCQEKAKERPVDDKSMVRKSPQTGSPFRYDTRKYFVGSQFLPNGIDVPGIVLLTLDEDDDPVDAGFLPCLTRQEIRYLDSYLNNIPFSTEAERKVARARRQAAKMELQTHGERIETAHDDEHFGRALAALDHIQDVEARDKAKAALLRTKADALEANHPTADFNKKTGGRR